MELMWWWMWPAVVAAVAVTVVIGLLPVSYTHLTLPTSDLG